MGEGTARVVGTGACEGPGPNPVRCPSPINEHDAEESVVTKKPSKNYLVKSTNEPAAKDDKVSSKLPRAELLRKPVALTRAVRSTRISGTEDAEVRLGSAGLGGDGIRAGLSGGGRSSGTTARSGKMLADRVCLKRRVNLVMGRTNDRKRAGRVPARMVQPGKPVVEEKVDREPGVQSFREARKAIEVVASVELTPKIESRGMTLAPEVSGGRKVTRGRMCRGLKPILGVQELLILLPSQRLAELTLLETHYKRHDGADGILARSRGRAWFCGGEKLARKVANRCVYYLLEDLEPGDVCKLLYETKVTYYRLCLTKEVTKSEDGLVRTIKVMMRNRRSGRSLVKQHLEPVEMKGANKCSGNAAERT